MGMKLKITDAKTLKTEIRRHEDDTDGMLDDLEEHYSKLSKDDLVELVMEFVIADNHSTEIVEMWEGICNGQTYGDNDTIELNKMKLDEAYAIWRDK